MRCAVPLVVATLATSPPLDRARGSEPDQEVAGAVRGGCGQPVPESFPEAAKVGGVVKVALGRHAVGQGDPGGLQLIGRLRGMSSRPVPSPGRSEVLLRKGGGQRGTDSLERAPLPPATNSASNPHSIRSSVVRSNPLRSFRFRSSVVRSNPFRSFLFGDLSDA
jgi:hypothetical protein